MQPLEQLSLVAFYGQKSPHPLWDKITGIQKAMLQAVPEYFTPYMSEQLHTTIVGLEAVRYHGRLLGKNYLELRQRYKSIDLRAIIRFLSKTRLLPMSIRIGGFKNNGQFSFKSRKASPYERSFSIQDDNVVLIGWPFNREDYISAADTLRRRLSRFGCLHKYYRQPDDYDNDLFLVIGTLNTPLAEAQKQALEVNFREQLAGWPPLTIELPESQLRIVRYEDNQLKKARAYTLTAAGSCLPELAASYPDYE